jgi:hypothetical protein
MENLIDGLGYDPSKEQFFTNTYAWQYIMPNTKKSQTFIGKSGITKYDVNTAMGEAAPTRGKQFHQRALWGYDSDRKYLKKGITTEQANEVVKKMDYFFKEDMIEIGWNLRHNKKSRELGTEFYEGPSDVWLETIKQKWNEAFIKANQLVIGEFEGQDLGDMNVMGSQGVVTEQINEVLRTHKKVRAIIPCGYGKGFLEFRGAYKLDKAKDSKIVIYYCHNIPATKQLSVKHAEYADGTIYQGTMGRYVICSEKKYVKGQANFGIENYSATDGKLKEVIQEAILSKQRTAFYVNNKSAGEFNDTFRLIATQLRYTKKPFVFIDEEQEFCGHISSSKTDAILNSIASYQVSFTATERRRGTDTNKDRIYNDDVKHFGHVAIEITPSETISEGRSCPIHFKTVEVSENHQLMRQIGVNGIIESVFADETSAAVRGRMLRAIVCLVKSIREEDKSHILLVTSLIVDTESAIILVNKLIEHQIIPNDYVVIRSLRQDGLDSTKRFNSLEKGILIGTPWLVTGIDAPNIDALVPTYDMGSEITATQFIGRGQRPVDDKELSVYIPIDPSETFIPSMLRVANNFILGENSHNIGTNTILEEGEEILGSIQRRRITSDIDREVNMNASYRSYWDNIYNDLTTNEIGSACDYSHFLPFEEAREYVRGLGIKNSIEYSDWCSSGNKPTNIPSDASRKYENEGWLSWLDFLGVIPGWVGNFNKESEEFLIDYFNTEHISYGECYRNIVDLVDILKIGPNTIKKKCKELKIDYPGLYGTKKDSYNLKYGTPEMCREWLWNNGYDRGYDDPKYIQYIKNGGDIPKWFRTFAYVSEGKVDTRYYNKRLQNQDNAIERMGELYSNGYSYAMLSKELGIPKTTIAKLVKKHGFKTHVDFETKKKLTHKVNNTKLGQPIKEVDLNHLQKHIIKHKIKTTREFKKSGYDLSLATIERRHPNFKWEDYKYNDKQKI